MCIILTTINTLLGYRYTNLQWMKESKGHGRSVHKWTVITMRYMSTWRSVTSFLHVVPRRLRSIEWDSIKNNKPFTSPSCLVLLSTTKLLFCFRSSHQLVFSRPQPQAPPPPSVLLSSTSCQTCKHGPFFPGLLCKCFNRIFMHASNNK